MNLESIAASYQRDGVVCIQRLLSRDRVSELRFHINRYIHEKVPRLPASARTFEPDGRTVRNLWAMEFHDDHFAALGKDPQLTGIAGTLVHGEPVLVAVETFNKPARVGSAVPYHQDNAYFCQAPPDMLTIWIALDPATPENGAVYYVPGSQHAMRPHQPSGVAGNSMAVTDPPDPRTQDEFCGALEPGDALIHHCQTMHRSEPNRSDQPRLALLLVYRGAHTRTDPALKSAYDAGRAAVPQAAVQNA